MTSIMATNETDYILQNLTKAKRFITYAYKYRKKYLEYDNDDVRDTYVRDMINALDALNEACYDCVDETCSNYDFVDGD